MTLGFGKMLQTEALPVKSLSFQLGWLWVPSLGHSQCNPHNSFCDSLSTQSQGFRHWLYYGPVNSCDFWKSQPPCTFAVFIQHWKTNYTDNLVIYTSDSWCFSQEDGAVWVRKASEEDSHTCLYPFSAQLQRPLNFMRELFPLTRLWVSQFTMGVHPVFTDLDWKVHEIDQPSSQST